MRDVAQKLLRQMTGNEQSIFHQGQWEAIDVLVNQQRQLLVVQRTGWGKSAVYFIATKLRRIQGFGPTIIISPLLSLIRNQIEAANKLGLRVVSYNSSMDASSKKDAERKILSGEIDAVIIAPEQLGQPYFSEKILSNISSIVGIFVVDEAHCISDWGHDFRPDYSRIVRFIQNMPENMPILATTATANNRVVNDIKAQLGERLFILRGPLTRKTLQLQNIHISNKSERLAWLAENIPSINGAGIIYAKTTKDCEIVAEFLQGKGVDAYAYHSNIDNEIKTQLEQALLSNSVKALVATSALGMGFDKPDLSFVIHYQSPGSVVEYYQQVGRAGRGIDNAVGIMMLGEDDGRIQQYFIENAFPKEDQINTLLEVVERFNGVKVTQIEPLVNFSTSKIQHILKFLSIENPSPVLRDGSFYYRTQFDYTLPYEKIKRLNTLKKAEWDVLLKYHQSTECLMLFLGRELDDINLEECGRCANCIPENAFSEQVDELLVSSARDYLRNRYVEIKPRVTFASSGANAKQAFTQYGFPYRDNKLLCEKGYALSSWKDGGWGDLVAKGKKEKKFSEELIPPMLKMINSLEYDERPTWITYIPSPRNPNLVKDFAYKLAAALNVPCLDALSVREVRPPQKTMENSFHQSKNLDGAFNVDATNISSDPVWLIDDAVDSRWTFTIAGALLRKLGVRKITPVALTSTTKNG